jgi:hypothetical protein
MLASSFRCRSLGVSSALRSRTFGPVYPRVVPMPATFPWTPTWTIIETAPGVFTTTLDPISLIPTTSATFYANEARPNNTGNGQSAAAAEQAIWAALADVGAGVHAKILVLGSTDPKNPTIYPWTKAWRVGCSANLHVSVVSDFTTLAPGYAVSSTALVAGDGELGAWGIAGGDGPNVYSATLTTAPGRVVDGANLDADGVATALTSRASVALVEANPGSYYHAAGVLYVRTFDSRAPTFPTLRPLRGGTSINGHVNGTRTVYVERLSFEGGSTQVVYIQDGDLTLVDCDVTNGTALGVHVNTGAGLTGATRALHCIRVRAIANAGDGIAYSAAGATMTLRGLEWNCQYKRNSGASTDQGGSAHRLTTNTEVSVIRVNPTCTANKSQGFADVGEGTDGCFILNVGGTITGEVSGYYCGNGTKAWLYRTVLAGNTTDLVTDNAAGVINVSGTHYATTSGAGTVQVYVP